ncbi:metallophosphoesterase [Paenibacillus sp. 1001270B_150601_E10]|uniref:metallophosphoesterase n=1 Tax=Paenibacillus sp. 1001270B_150601_E10 TaxID=2787079 RepID=UPI00189FB9CF|nr:metallophosphoesterase [Paenibacillus sp. 1001270B_150601_E10]
MLLIDLLIYGGLLISIIAGALLLVMYLEAKQFHVTEEVVVLDELDPAFDGTRLFFISDLHRRPIKQSHMDMIASHERAKLIIIGGDVIERGDTFECCRANLQLLRSLGPAVMVHGNHDNKADVRVLDAYAESIGIRVLDNEAMRCESQDGVLWFAGIDDLRSGRANVQASMAEVFEEPACTLLISHDPAVLRRTIPSEVQLILCGHTHGGQINLPFYGPVRTGAIYRRFQAGWYDVPRGDGTHYKMFISRGFGTSHIPFRWFSPPEAHFITLKSKTLFS